MRKAYQKQVHRKTKRGVGRGSAALEDAVQLTLDRSEVMREMQEGLHRLGVTIGLELAALMMKDEVERLCGSRYEHPAERAATRHGQQRGVITIAGQKIGIEKPRVRSTKANREVPLEASETPRRANSLSCLRLKPHSVLLRSLTHGRTPDMSRQTPVDSRVTLVRSCDERHDGLRSAQHIGGMKDCEGRCRFRGGRLHPGTEKFRAIILRLGDSPRTSTE